MNILFVGHEKDLNGASLSLLGIIDNLKHDNNIYVLTSYKDGDFYEALRKRNINVIYGSYFRWMIPKSKRKIKWIIKRCLGLLACVMNYVTALKLKNKIKMAEIDIIHSNSSVINIGAIIAKMCNIPHMWHMREFGEEDFNMYHVYPKSYALNYINRNSNAIIAISKAVYSKYKIYFDKNKLMVIYNGISSENIQVKNFEKQKKCINMIICGRIEEAKGQESAILALHELIRRGYNNLNLNIAGSGNTERIVALINKFNLESNIKLLGKVNNLIDVRKDIDMELVCSKNEAFGRVTIEAMMSMIPVIGANTGGTKELIKDGYNGFLYNQGDYIDLANKIEIFIKDRSKIEYMGKNAYNFSKDFTSDINAEKIYSIYKNIIEIYKKNRNIK